MKKYILYTMPLLLGLYAGCKPGKPAEKDKSAYKGIDIALLDSNYIPGNDFFEFVNAKWIKGNPIPGTESSWGSFNILREESKKVLREILAKAADDGKAPKGSNTQLLGSFYRSGMDSVAANKAGASSLQSVLDEIQKLDDKAAIARYYATQMQAGTIIPLALFVEQDFQNTTRYISYIYQNGLGLPDRDYYLKTGGSFDETKTAYKDHIRNIFIAAGDDSATAAKKMKNVYNLEEKLAKASMSNVDVRDPYKTYNLVTREKLQTEYPNFDWETYFTTLGINQEKEIVLGMTGFLKEWNNLLQKVPAAEWKDYYTFHLLNSHADYLGETFENENFSFYGKNIEGKTEKEPRWKEVTDLADGLLRDVLGQEYIKMAFDEKAKARADELIKNLRIALGERIQQLTWMGDATKQKAKEKLDKMMVKIGYPEKWRSYEGLEISDQPFVLNVMACNTYEYKRNLKRLGNPIDRTEWQMGPQTVNAYYNPLLNEIVFPAAILQPPFFHAEADDAVNYGGIGMVIGHELTHGFDDQGSQFDADGNLKNWWTSEDSSRFKALTGVFVKQYSKYEPLDSLFVNGELTLGENIADLGGMTIAYNAFKKTEQGKSTEKMDGLTPDQRFFISYAQIWRGHSTDESLRNQVITDPHSPRKFRVIGVLSNFEPFYEAFNITEGSALFITPGERAVMW